MEKISNKILESIIHFAESNLSYSLQDCCDKLNFKYSTVYNWQKNLKSKKWKHGYDKTQDEKPLSEKIINQFLGCFQFSKNSSKILKKLLTNKCLNNKHCYIKQLKVLKNIFKKYSDVNFWLYCNLGEPKDEMLFYLGKNEDMLKKKYIDFTAKDEYIKFKQDYKPKPKKKAPKTKRNIWDYY